MEKEQDYWKAETVAFLALQSIRGVGFKTLYKIAAQKISFRELIKTDDIEHFEKMLRQKLDDSIKESAESWMLFKLDLWNKGLELAREYTKKNIRIFFYDQDLFPQQLKSIPEPPMWLFVEGNYKVLHQPSVAIVGSRKATEDGLWLTKYIIAAMANQGLVSVSGLAEGIDQKAHIESIRFNVPTIAVLGTGIDSNYPRGSEHLRAEIVANGGAIVTEYLIHQSYSAQNFVRRNRIQASLAQITAPVEWKIKSGTAHTVNFTKDYGRFLMMPYLYQSDLENAEIKAVSAYKRGQVYIVPDQSSDLIKYLKKPEESQPIQGMQGQFSMDL
ncbi:MULTISPECIES: DNA-processing protein DprA [unclassified Pseudoalteromonas]|jgi:DNA protecting protein DprA|uniref:DNA-processing protein DprA n=1 Tax=unclassified Pseudoalteromonas TaxID=194690 RepID=UPI00235889B6|nr:MULTISPECIES: DNA-processing protein DprA [unclassified Pseudoalteromonas]MDC9502932.1 DNA-protecting protein DprA [Pseudoalteromonas sp. Angola-18]MDC9530363.1 DNA-protecting protein DprA [Pseudoalteromonas sp. Angola-7]